jgi:hypothetical protein
MNGTDGLFKMRDEIETRWFSLENPKGLKGEATRGDDGRKRSAHQPLRAGESLVLAEVTGRPGVVRRLWFAVTDGKNECHLQRPEILRGLRLDFYWDGAATPAVSAPFGDFFCQGLGKTYAFENSLFASPEGRSFLCTVPMPFRESMKLVVTNECDEAIAAFFFEVDCTLGDTIGNGDLYFHSHWRRENPTVEGRDFEFLPKVTGNGRFLGVNFSVVANRRYGKCWWGEGEVKVYLDGDTTCPTLCGTGTEDYIGTGWGQGKFSFDNCGCPYADDEKVEYAFYRLHLPDPVYFRKEIRATIQQMGGAMPDMLARLKELDPSLQLRRGEEKIDIDAYLKANKPCLFDRSDDWASCVYFYLDKPENGLPPLAHAEERTNVSFIPSS